MEVSNNNAPNTVKNGVPKKHLRRIKQRLGLIFKQYKFLQFLTVQLNFALDCMHSEENPVVLRVRLAEMSGCTSMPPLFKGLKPIHDLDENYDLSLNLLVKMFTEPQYLELSDTIAKGIRQLVKYHKRKVAIDLSYSQVLMRGLRNIWVDLLQWTHWVPARGPENIQRMDMNSVLGNDMQSALVEGSVTAP